MGACQSQISALPIFFYCSHAASCASLAHTPNQKKYSAGPSCPSCHVPHDRGASGSVARHRRHVACAAAAGGRHEVQPFKRLADLTLLSYARPSSRPQIDPSARRTVEGAHAAQHTRFAVINMCSTNSSHSFVPKCGRICRARSKPGALTSSALQRYAARRRARRASTGEVAAAVEAVYSRAR